MDDEKLIATQQHLFEVTEQELVQLIKLADHRSLLTTLGSNTKVIWRKGEQMPWYVIELAKMRGVWEQNMSGDGI